MNTHLDERTEEEIWEDVNKVYVYDSRGPARGWAQIVKEKTKWPEDKKKKSYARLVE